MPIILWLLGVPLSRLLESGGLDAQRLRLSDALAADSPRVMELNLPGAAQMIEILALLEQKTKGNLTAEERQVLEQVLYELRLRFVEVSGVGKRIIEP